MLQRLKRDTRGAVLAEFVIAIVPVLTTFFMFVQLSRIAMARLVVKHSAIIGARAAAVISNAHDNTPDQPVGVNQGEVLDAVKSALGPWFTRNGGVSSVVVTVTDSSSKDDPYDWVEVKVSATYECRIPMGFIVCGGGTKKLDEVFRMPHQGATYKM